MAKIPQETGRGFSVTDTSAVNVNNTTSEITLFSQLIPGGKMGSLKTLGFKAVCYLTTPAISLPALTIKVKFGSSTLTLASGLILAINQTNQPFMVIGEITNKATNSQSVWSKIDQNASSSLPIVLATSSTLMGAKWTEDTTTDKTFSITAQFSLLSGGTTLSADNVIVELS